jgi:CheY-like chemotaxis protein
MGYSQEVLSERSDLYRTYISDVERGVRNLSLESIVRLAQALDISVATLFPDVLNHAATGGHGRSGLDQSFVEILLVEDNADDVELTLRAFKQARFANRVTVVTDGQAALDYLFRRGPHADQSSAKLPQVILLDLSLPKVSGLEVLRQIKSDPQVSQSHVVILSASNYQEDMARCRRLGVEDYLIKPVDFQGLSRVTPRLKLDWVLFKPAAEVI